VIKFACSQCGKHIAVDDKHAGKKGKCPGCGEAVVVPGKSAAIRFACEHCGHRIKVPQHYAGKKGKCPKCKEAVVVPAPKTKQAEEPQTPTIICSMCGQAVSAPEDSTDESMECPACGSLIDASSGEMAAPYDEAAPTADEEDVYEASDETTRESEGVDRRLILILAGVAVIVVVGIIGAIVFLKGSGPEPAPRPVTRRAAHPVTDTEPASQPTDPAPAPGATTTEPAVAAAAAAVQLRFAPTSGTRRFMRVTTENHLSVQARGRTGNRVHRDALTFELETAPPDANGNTPIAVTLAAVQMKRETEGRTLAEYDSTQPPDGTNNYAAKYAPFVSGRCTMTVSAQGRIVDLDLDRLYRAVAEVRLAAQGDATDPRYASREEQLQALKTQCENLPTLGKKPLWDALETLVAVLPEQPLRPGDTWSGQSTVDVSVPIEMAATYTVAAATDKVCTIKMESRRSAEQEPIVQMDQITFYHTLGGTAQATLTVDRSSGWLLSREQKTSLSGQYETHRANQPDRDTTSQVSLEITTTVETIPASSESALPGTQGSERPLPAAAPAVQLRFAPAPGAKRTMRVTTRIDTSVQAAGQQHAITGIESLTLDLETTPANADGAVPVRITLAAVQVKSEMGGVPLAEYDSAKAQDSAAGLGEIYGPFVGKDFTMTVSDRGEIVDFGLDELFGAAAEHRVRAEDIETQERLEFGERAEQAIAHMDQRFGSRADRVLAMKEQLEASLFGKEKIRGLLNECVVALPDESLGQGDHWSRPIRIPQVSEDMEMAAMHTLTTVAGDSCTIQSEGHRSLEEAPIIKEMGQAKLSHKLGGDCHTTVTVDRQTGWLLRREQKTNLSGQMETSGTGQPGQDTTVPVSLEITTTVTTVE
jgi:DNA-directed RNA polymerase subunit RPC12/RpoP